VDEIRLLDQRREGPAFPVPAGLSKGCRSAFRLSPEGDDPESCSWPRLEIGGMSAAGLVVLNYAHQRPAGKSPR
jgi:hypothetical protein